MSLPSLLDGIPEVRAALSADGRGRLRASTSPERAERDAAAAAVAVGELSAAGSAVGLARLELLLVKGARGATVTAIRGDELLCVDVDPTRGTGQVEKALHAWATGVPADGAAGASAQGAPAAPAPGVERRDRLDADPWAGLRHALLRGLLTEAAARRRAIAEALPTAGRAGTEPLPAAELDGAIQVLLQGIGSVLAGDGVAGARTLEPLAGTGQRNLSLRWLALYWSGRGALLGGNTAAARTHLTQALLLAKQLDAAALAASQWVAAEVLAHDADHARALACLAAARSGFERLDDRWGLGQTWLAEARALAAQGQEDAAAAAARRARATDAAWEGPAVFLARQALQRGDPAEAEAALRGVAGPASARVRGVLEALRGQLVAPADAGEFLRASDAAPSARSIRALERIAQAAPRFAQAREALAWMLLKVGKYPEASTIFRGLLAAPLAAADRASVMLGLGCIAHAQQAGKDPAARLHAAVLGGAAAPAPQGAGGEVVPLPNLSSTALPARSSQAAGAAVFSGQLGVFPLPDVIEFVRSARRTGLLVCSSEQGMAAVQFREGRITGATSPGAPDLGELLVRARKLSTVALRAARTALPAGAPDHVLAGRLVKERLADDAAVREALRRKIEAALQEVLRWPGGEFAFDREAEAAPETPGQVEFDAQDVLLNVLKQMDEDARERTAPAAPR
jgi:hypothetical protein